MLSSSEQRSREDYSLLVVDIDEEGKVLSVEREIVLLLLVYKEEVDLVGVDDGG